MYVYLVVDQRECKVHNFITQAFSGTQWRHTTKTINTGDYQIWQHVPGSPPELLAVVERKTLPDFASSFTDGRYRNTNKMLDLRERLGCQLYYFVEGPAFPSPSRKFSRIPYANILSSITKLMARDGIHVVFTENEMHTAKRLLEFVKAYESTETPFKHEIKIKDSFQGGELKNIEYDETQLAVPQFVQGLVAKSDFELVTLIWSRLFGVSLATAGVIARDYSVRNFLAQDAAIIDKLKTPTGKALARKAKNSLRSLLTGDKKTCIRLLSGFPGISVGMATSLLAKTTLRNFLDDGLEKMATRELTQKERTVKFGATRAARVLKLANFCASSPENPVSSPETPPPNISTPENLLTTASTPENPVSSPEPPLSNVSTPETPHVPPESHLTVDDLFNVLL